MKTKSVSVKLCDSFKFPTETHLEDSLLSTFPPQNKKNSSLKITSSASLSKSSASPVKILSIPGQKSKKKASRLLKSIENTKNPKKSQKKKLIKKGQKMSAKTLTNRRKSVGEKKKDKKVEIQTEGGRQRKENRKKLFNKQNIETKTNQNVSQQEQSLSMEEKPRKVIDLDSQSFKLQECIQIKWLSLERRQLQRKREDLLKRNVEDWDMIQKGRSAYRELRSLNN